ncbi:asparagine synthase (glutamine-hydrolyzing) [Thermoflavifilum thermophilum]|uniref:asparagine synthase (glutamine-hydrolyzing) n=1 Tax=Thermoflavifilum thermophilum TaxID=1393122 RepID=A0A1I7N9Y6_9BACT|nr:asparagine synthase (glutamine-hydrolyzing) [Thermoflavifilum thermophilum]SFV31393.1 asparagine synthase (glutamine-hydrolysing) [Thermoflavifilum thermophilum]
MCRIAGLYDPESPDVAGKLLRMRDAMHRGGPDDAGMYLSPHLPLGLAHRRLSVIDLSQAGHQPMCHDMRPLVITFNGEIYNYRELRQNLMDAGEHFHTATDTEVILRGYARMGMDILPRLRGMFAFAIWDEEQRELLLVRDRMGIKPLYYGLQGTRFFFASELKAFRQAGFPLPVSLEAAAAFLQTGSIPVPLTLYENVWALPPGHYVRVQWRQDQPVVDEPTCWWCFTDLLATAQVRAGSQGYTPEAREAVRQALIDSLQVHLVADVEVGAFLSGGIDSTAIVSLLRQIGVPDIRTVSVVFPGHELDESNYARLAASHFHTRHEEVVVTLPDLLGQWEDMLGVMDQPTIDGLNVYMVSQAARKAGLKVVLSGLGGDELFGGYPSFRWVPRLRRWQASRWLPLAVQIAAWRARSVDRRRRLQAFVQQRQDPRAAYRLVRGLFTDAELQEMRWPSPLPANPYADLTDAPARKTPASPGHDRKDDKIEQVLTPLQYVSYLESRYYMRNQLLRDADVFSMAHGLELRVPFVDHHLYAAVWPYLDAAYRHGYPKRLLVEATGSLPLAIIHRPKQGFTFPFADWIRQEPLCGQIADGLHRLSKTLDLRLEGLCLPDSHWSRTWALFVLSQFVV